jgi:phosphoglycolate phosphatase
MVVFDWNGTIVVDADRARDALNSVLASHHAAPVSAAEFPVTFGLPMAEMLGGLGVQRTRLAAAETQWNTLMAASATRLRAGAGEALTQLAADGTWLGIVSAASAEAVMRDRVSLAVPDVWHSMLAPAGDKAAILRALRHHAGTAVYVGDTPYDMRCAEQTGYLPIGVRSGYSTEPALRSAGASAVIDDLRDLPGIVQAASAEHGQIGWTGCRGREQQL